MKIKIKIEVEIKRSNNNTDFTATLNLRSRQLKVDTVFFRLLLPCLTVQFRTIPSTVTNEIEKDN